MRSRRRGRRSPRETRLSPWLAIALAELRRWGARPAGWIGVAAAGALAASVWLRAAPAGGAAAAVASLLALHRALTALVFLGAACAVAPGVGSGTLLPFATRTPRTRILLGRGAAWALAGAMASALGAGAALWGAHASGAPVADLLAPGFVAWLLSLFPLLAAVSVGLLVSSLAHTRETAVGAAASLGMLFAVISLDPEGAPGVFSATMSWPYERWTAAGLGGSASLPALLVARHVAVNLAWTAAALPLAVARFARRDLAQV